MLKCLEKVEVRRKFPLPHSYAPTPVSLLSPLINQSSLRAGAFSDEASFLGRISLCCVDTAAYNKNGINVCIIFN